MSDDRYGPSILKTDLSPKHLAAAKFLEGIGASVRFEPGRGWLISVPERMNVLEKSGDEMIEFAKRCGYSEDGG